MVVDLVSVGGAVELQVDVGAQLVLGAEHLQTLRQAQRRQHTRVINQNHEEEPAAAATHQRFEAVPPFVDPLDSVQFDLNHVLLKRHRRSVGDVSSET